MIYVDVKYANMLGPRLRNFKHKNDYLWNFSCPVCGDSKKNKAKARGYIFKLPTGAGLAVKCHKCGYSTNLGNFIKYLDPVLYQEYVLENYKESGTPRSQHSDAEIAIPAVIKAPELTDDILSSIKRLDSLPVDHPAVQYCLQRKIGSKFFSLLYFAPKFKKYTNTVVPNKFKDLEDDHPRLIIPYFNNFGKCFAFQARAFGNEEPKYYTIKIDETEERIYGLDRVKYSSRIYCTEGPIDSLFIPNCIAVSGSSFNTPIIQSLKTNLTIIYDNEPRAPTLTKLVKSTIDAGFTVCLWPETFEYKDINDAIKGGMSVEDIMRVVEENTFSGPSAQLRFTTWKKC
jgi:transcription elongation factor Elf1